MVTSWGCSESFFVPRPILITRGLFRSTRLRARGWIGEKYFIVCRHDRCMDGENKREIFEENRGLLGRRESYGTARREESVWLTLALYTLQVNGIMEKYE